MQIKKTATKSFLELLLLTQIMAKSNSFTEDNLTKTTIL